MRSRQLFWDSSTHTLPPEWLVWRGTSSRYLTERPYALIDQAILILATASVLGGIEEGRGGIGNCGNETDRDLSDNCIRQRNWTICVGFARTPAQVLTAPRRLVSRSCQGMPCRNPSDMKE